LFEECDAVPVALDGDLRKEQSAVSGHADEKSVATHFYRFGRDWLRRRKDAEFNFELGCFFEGDRIEAGVFEGGGARGVGDGAIDGADGKDVADTSAQIAVQIE
jgi:hypothetical protein